jgi:hypothetical protein
MPLNHARASYRDFFFISRATAVLWFEAGAGSEIIRLGHYAPGVVTKEDNMNTDKIVSNMEVIGADGVHIGTVDAVTDGRIRLTTRDSGERTHKGHDHFISLGLVADVEGQKVRLSANAAVAVTFEEEESGKPV